MLAIKLIMEGFGLGFLLYLVCAIGIRNGAVGMIHLYEQKVQNRAVELGMTTEEEIKKRSLFSAYMQSTARGVSGPASGRRL